MKNMIKKGLVCLWAGCAFTACSDTWDNHFEASGAGAGIPEESLMELIARDASLSKFAEILRVTGADAYLSSNQTYTVWVPTNAALADVDMSDMEALNRLVNNHIARYSNPTSTAVGEPIYMLNGKTMSYHSAENFSGVNLLQSNLLAQNGVFHVLDEQIPYRFNPLEYASIHENYDSLYKYMMFFNEKRYDESLSTAYDSVFVDYNPMLESLTYGIGQVNVEDSVYTVIMPDNAAWEKAYQHISPYFRVWGYDENYDPANKNPQNVTKAGTAEYADSVMRVQTAQAILNGLTFRGVLDAPAALDSVNTVTRNAIYETAAYFNGYTAEEASNGLMYLANGNLNLDDTCTWNRTIVVEAENPDTRGTTNSNPSGIYVRRVDSDEYVTGISAGQYLEIMGKSSGSDGGSVDFYIPNVLAGKYDVYVDFVPPIVDGEAAAQQKSRAKFQMYYVNSRTGLSAADKQLTDKEGWIVGGTVEAVDDEDGTETERKPAGLITLKAYEGYEFGLSDYYDGMWYMQDENDEVPIPKIKLRIGIDVTTTEVKNGFSRTLRVDKIRFVPVVE